jgi:hypothetical protein
MIRGEKPMSFLSKLFGRKSPNTAPANIAPVNVEAVTPPPEPRLSAYEAVHYHVEIDRASQTLRLALLPRAAEAPLFRVPRTHVAEKFISAGILDWKSQSPIQPHPYQDPRLTFDAGPVQPRTATKEDLWRKAVVHIRPEITVEPLASYYLERARACNGLASTLYCGAAIAVAEELGYEQPALPAGLVPEICREAFRDWQRALLSDPDIAPDIRSLTPIEETSGEVHARAVLGWTFDELFISFDQPPSYRVLAPDGSPAEVEAEMSELTCKLWRPEIQSVRLTRLLSPDEFRYHCDRYKSAEEIIASLP